MDGRSSFEDDIRRGTRVDLAYPMMSTFNHDGKKLFGMEISISSRNITLIRSSTMCECSRGSFRRKLSQQVLWREEGRLQQLVERLEAAGVDLIECSFSCPQGNIGEDPGKMLAQSCPATELTARWVKKRRNAFLFLSKSRRMSPTSLKLLEQ